MEFLKSRFLHIRQIGRWWWLMIAAAWSLLWQADSLVGKYGTTTFKATWDAMWIRPRWGWQVWIIGLLVITTFAIFEGSFRHARKRETNHITILSSKEHLIAKLSQPSDFPTVRIIGWGEFGQADRGLSNAGFFLHNEGKTAYEVTMKTFPIGSYLAKSRLLPTVPGEQRGTGQLLVWLEDASNVDDSKWNLPGAFRAASEQRDAHYYTGIYGVPNYTVQTTMTYRDHRNLWYRTTQEVIYIPSKQDFEFGPANYECLGITPPTA